MLFRSKLYRKEKSDLVQYSLNHTPQEVKTSHGLNVVFFAEITKDDETTVIVNLSLLFLETILGQCETWEIIENTLTPVMVDSYTAELPNFMNPKRALRGLNLLGSTEFEVGYTNINTPEDRNVKNFFDRLTDLVITKIDEDSLFDLNNCICSVNGLVGRPVMHNGEMFIKNGMSFMWSTTEERHPSMVLLDFSELGGIEIVPLSSCEIRYRNKDNTPEADIDICALLPEGYDLTNVSVFPVIANSFFFPSSVQVVTKRSLVLSPSHMRIRESLLKRASCQENYIDSSYTLEAGSTVSDYMTKTIKDPQHNGAFLILVKTPSLWIHQLDVFPYAHSTDSFVGKDGILFDRGTQSIIDYTQMPYDSVTDIYRIELPKILEIDPQGNTKKQLAFERVKCGHLDDLLDHTRADLSLIRIFGF